MLLAFQKPSGIGQASNLHICTELLQLTAHFLDVQQHTCTSSTAGKMEQIPLTLFYPKNSSKGISTGVTNNTGCLIGVITACMAVHSFFGRPNMPLNWEESPEFSVPLWRDIHRHYVIVVYIFVWGMTAWAENRAPARVMCAAQDGVGKELVHTWRKCSSPLTQCFCVYCFQQCVIEV